MSSAAKKYCDDVAALIRIMENMENLFKEEVSVDSLYKLEGVVVEAKRSIYEVLMYANSLQGKYDAAADKEKWKTENSDDARDFGILVLPICGLDLYLNELEAGLRKHRLTLEKILEEKVPTPYLWLLRLEAKRFRDVNATDLSYRLTGLRVLQRQIW